MSDVIRVRLDNKCGVFNNYKCVDATLKSYATLNIIFQINVASSLYTFHLNV